MKNIIRGLIFFIGWILSPMTYWNDPFINIPLSYFMANVLFYILHLPFKWLVVGSYWLTNFLGLFFMYSGGKRLIISSKNRFKAAAILIIFVMIYSAVMLYLEKEGKLLPFCKYFKEYCVER